MMKIILTAATMQLFLLVTGNNMTLEGKRIKCLYFGPTNEKMGSLYPEDINTTLCTHLVYIPLEKFTNGEIYLMPNNSDFSADRLDIVSSLARLKSINPELKLILHITYSHTLWDFVGSSEKSNMIQNGTKWLQKNKFDGIDIPIPFISDKMEEFVDLMCEIKREYDKHGFIVSTTLEELEADYFPQPIQGKEDVISKLARCCDLVTLRKSMYDETVTHRLLSLSSIKSSIDSFNKRGIPLDKLLITILTSGNIFTLSNPNDTSIGANISVPDGSENPGFLIIYKNLMAKMNDPSLNWTFHRDEETKEPYAFTNTGLWAAYEDNPSIEFKARYVKEKGLGGVEIESLDTDDNGEPGEDGRFPFTRTIYKIFAGLQTADTTK